MVLTPQRIDGSDFPADIVSQGIVSRFTDTEAVLALIIRGRYWVLKITNTRITENQQSYLCGFPAYDRITLPYRRRNFLSFYVFAFCHLLPGLHRWQRNETAQYTRGLYKMSRLLLMMMIPTIHDCPSASLFHIQISILILNISRFHYHRIRSDFWSSNSQTRSTKYTGYHDSLLFRAIVKE